MTAQGVIVAAIVGASALYLARRWYRMLAGKSTGCGCGECPHHDAPPAGTRALFNPKSISPHANQNPK